MEDLGWLYTTFTGRLGRWKYFVWGSVPGIVSLVAGKLVGNPLITLPLALVVLWMNLCVGAKRWHDLGKSGQYNWLLLIPFLNFFVAMYMLFAPGMAGPNEYGEPHN